MSKKTSPSPFDFIFPTANTGETDEFIFYWKNKFYDRYRWERRRRRRSRGRAVSKNGRDRDAKRPHSIRVVNHVTRIAHGFLEPGENLPVHPWHRPELVLCLSLIPRHWDSNHLCLNLRKLLKNCSIPVVFPYRRSHHLFRWNILSIEIFHRNFTKTKSSFYFFIRHELGYSISLKVIFSIGYRHVHFANIFSKF